MKTIIVILAMLLLPSTGWAASKAVGFVGQVQANQIDENAVQPDELSAISYHIDFCGQNVENGPVYFGPVVTDHFMENDAATVDASIGGTVCDGLDSATEATADAPVFTNVPFKITGMFCTTDGTLGSGETLTFATRSAAAATTPSVTCSLAAGESDCVSNTGSTTDIAAGATVAVLATQSSNNSDDNSWCRVWISLKE